MIELQAGDASASIDPRRGGRLASLVVDGQELLLTSPAPDDRSIRWGSFLMAPWPGRLRNGVVAWGGRHYQLPRTHGRHAIHGLVHDRAWSVERSVADEAELACELGPAGWPFGGLMRQRLRLDPSGLTLHAEVIAEQAMPAALGWHPWFRRAGADPCLRVDGAEVLVTKGLIPTGERLPVRGRTDLRSGPAMGHRRLDHVYPDVRSPITVEWPGLTLAIEFDPPLGVAVIHTPAAGFCVEPQTAWPNALAGEAYRGAGASPTSLEAGGKLVATTRFGWTRRTRPG